MLQEIKVLVVDDSAFMRKVISDILNADPRIRVIATARNGEEALKKRRELRPDVITLDVEMPVLDGLETLKRLMEEDPCPVVMVSSTTREGARNTLIAMEYGAVDFVTKPSGSISLDMEKVGAEMRKKVILAAKANVTYARKPKKQTFSFFRPIVKKPFGWRRKVVAIGTSTGGPKALKEVITQLPSNFDAPIFIVQHMPAHFTRTLAERLNALANIHVKEAEDGEKVENNTAYIAPGGYHMEVVTRDRALYIRTHLGAPKRGHRPAVDVLFESLANIDEIETIAVIMTGMGADGSEGLVALKRTGRCYSIAESEQSCVVFGMPKAAIKTNLVDDVVHLDKIANKIVEKLGD